MITRQELYAAQRARDDLRALYQDWKRRRPRVVNCFGDRVGVLNWNDTEEKLWAAYQSACRKVEAMETEFFAASEGAE